ncbi:MAG: hypothetical protein C0508_11000 [Cyanobacteria bacterium PR.023]|nr:hypothetical protein [Cyanobacteria bacterium PR.023]
MEAKRQELYWPGDLRSLKRRDDTTSSVSTPNPSGGFARVDTKKGSALPLTGTVAAVTETTVQNPSRARTTERKGLKPNVLRPALEELPMLSNITKESVVYAGIDYHKRTIAVALGDKEGRILEQVNLQNQTRLVTSFFKQFSKIECVVESCRGYEWLVEMLQNQGHVVHVGDSRSIKLIAHSRCNIPFLLINGTNSIQPPRSLTSPTLKSPTTFFAANVTKMMLSVLPVRAILARDDLFF